MTELCNDSKLEGKVTELCDDTELEATVVELCGNSKLESNIELEGSMIELCNVICDVVGLGKLVGLTEKKKAVSAPVDNSELRSVCDITTIFVFAGGSVVENGNDGSEVVKLLRQQSSPPRPCPAATSAAPAVTACIATTHFGKTLELICQDSFGESGSHEGCSRR